ncbi:MAG TPA: nitrate reductase molybdenum cofactor assembly chaperone [Alphaproteobacteria bacterium]|nr:nitrate reductase molybdenum cofactor assembly chaperone [Alphaproteobacteria bacterium]
MSGSEMLVLRALSALLSYPRPELRAALPEIAATVRSSQLLKLDDREAVLRLIDLLVAMDALQAEERYVELFDRGRATSLHLFEHVHGDARDRGTAMVELKAIYERAGFQLTANELPDYLPVVLEYLSCRDLAEAREMLSDCANILRAIGETLMQRGSCYSAIFQALLVVAGEPGLDTKKASRRATEREDLDSDWFEQPAFAPEPPTSGGAAGAGCARRMFP